MNNSWIIKGGRIMDPSTGRNEISDLYIDNGRISDTPSASAQIYDAAGMIVAPGFIDLHAHFREPGNEKAETIRTGSQAAAHGGFTHVVTMPNTNPPADTPELIRKIIQTGHKLGFVKILPSATITAKRAGKETSRLDELASAGASAFTDDGTTVESSDLMLKAMKTAAQLNIPVMDHALSPSLAGNGVMRASKRAEELGFPGIPFEAETEMVKRDIDLAEKSGCHLHIQHLSSGRSVELIRAGKAKGSRVSAEATPHHIALSIDDIKSDDANFKMNPPLGTPEDCWNIINGIVDGTIEAFATDHAPHTAEDKAKGFLNAPFGIIGLETAVGITYTVLVKSGIMNIMDWIARWTSGPAKIIKLTNHSILKDNPADITILNDSRIWTVADDCFMSKSRNSPFIGKTLICKPAAVLIDGRLTFSDR